MAVNNQVAGDIGTIERIDECYTKASKVRALLQNEDLAMEFATKKTVLVKNIKATGTSAYGRFGSGSDNALGAVGSYNEEYQVKQNRYFALPFDKLDNVEDNNKAFKHNSQRYAIEHLIPEYDTYCLSKLAGYASTFFGNLVTKSDANLANNIYSEITKGKVWMAGRGVPVSRIAVFISWNAYGILENSTEINRKLDQSDYKKGEVLFTINNLDGMKIVPCEDDQLYTKANPVNNVGPVPTNDSYKIQFLMVDMGGCVCPERVNELHFRSSDNEHLPGGHFGNLIEGLQSYDIFMPDNKLAGIYCCISDEKATTVANAIRADFKAGATSGKTIITRIATGEVLWDKVGNYVTNGTAPAIGSSYTVADEDAVAVFGETIEFKEFTPNSTHNILVAVLDGKVVAVSKDFEDDQPTAA